MAKTTRKQATRKKTTAQTTTRVATTTKRAATTQKSAATAPRSQTRNGFDPLFGFSLTPWTATAKILRKADAKNAKAGHVIVFGRRDTKEARTVLKRVLLPWQVEHAIKNEAEAQSFAGKKGAVFIVRPTVKAEGEETHAGLLEKSSYARIRDQVGALVTAFTSWKLETVVFSFVGTEVEDERAAMTGLEIGSYSFVDIRGSLSKGKRKLPRLQIKQTKMTPQDLKAAADLGVSVNFARHLTNLPGGTLNPASYAAMLEDVFENSDTVTVDVWRGERLVKEKMNLLLAVGGAAEHAPCLVHLSYRPKGEGKAKPLAFVGKGITFDSGGLDIKPSSGMRWMKKDMGGSAAVAGLALWAERTRFTQPLDLYLSIAENAVGSRSFRPGDIITARSGHTIEIQNTDAEGRLVLADALDVAIEAVPAAVINVATLTGASKVALGTEISGLYSNNDSLAAALEESAQATGELTWRMPLFQPYKNMLKSPYADMANSADGFAGAITAAVFLHQFVKTVPWAHFDIYAWRDSASGAWTESGGSGQTVQLLSDFLTRFAAK